MWSWFQRNMREIQKRSVRFGVHLAKGLLVSVVFGPVVIALGSALYFAMYIAHVR